MSTNQEMPTFEIGSNPFDQILIDESNFGPLITDVDPGAEVYIDSGLEIHPDEPTEGAMNV